MMNKTLKALIIVVVIAILATTIIVFDSNSEYEKTAYAMAAQIDIKLIGKNNEEVCEKINKRIVECENKEISRNISTSDISKINSRKNAAVSEKTRYYLESMVDFSKNCGGALDLTVGKLTALWGIGTDDFKVPDEKEIKKALSGIGYEKIKINKEFVSIGRDQSLDLGSVGKGIACDEALEIAKANDVKQLVISVGGSVCLWNKNENKDFTVGIRNPEKSASDYIITVKTNNVFASTSGTYERFSTDKKGKTYHHILSTVSGYPVENDILSVTVFADNGMMSDALSSACLILGYENSDALLEKYKASAVFVFKDKSVKVSKNFDYKLEMKNNSYVLK